MWSLVQAMIYHTCPSFVLLKDDMFSVNVFVIIMFANCHVCLYVDVIIDRYIFSNIF